MCRGDDPTCPAFEVHLAKFQEDMARERRSFLKSRFAAGLIAGTPTALLPKRAAAAAKHHHLPANADTVHWGFFSKKLKPVVTIDSGDFVTIEAITHHSYDDYERLIKGDPGVESIFYWDKKKKNVNRRGAGPMDASIKGRGAGEGWPRQSGDAGAGRGTDPGQRGSRLVPARGDAR